MTTPLLEAPLPIAAAPMAGGPTTVALVHAVTDAGGFGFLAGGYKTADALADEIAQVRGRTSRFGVNLFVPGPSGLDPEAFRRYAAELQPEADAYGLELDPRPIVDDDGWTDKIGLLIDNPVPVVSLTFALPDPTVIAALQQAGSRVLVTVTTAAEARAAQTAGADGLVVQGTAAGGHSATFDPTRRLGEVSTATLVREVRATVAVPVIAAGGVDGPEAVGALLEAGAESVVVGTLLLRSDEAGTSATHRAALADPAFTETVITRAFTGRPTRALRNGFIDRHEPSAVPGYPAVHHLTRALRQAAGRAGDAQRLHLWAGTGYRNAPRSPAGETMRWLTGTKER